MQMQICEFVAMSSSIQMHEMQVMYKRKSTIYTKLQLIQEFELCSNHSVEMQIVQCTILILLLHVPSHSMRTF
jgi:hypothetical protein